MPKLELPLASLNQRKQCTRSRVRVRQHFLGLVVDSHLLNQLGLVGRPPVGAAEALMPSSLIKLKRFSTQRLAAYGPRGIGEKAPSE